MADALKAEGNKAFAAKNFEEAMYAPQSFKIYLSLNADYIQ